MSDLTVIIAGLDVTPNVDALSFSNVDPGGYEQATLSVTGGLDIKPGDRLRIYCDAELAWDGRINEPGNGNLASRAIDQITAVGHGATLKDLTYQEIYVDRDLSHWGDTSLARKANLFGANLRVETTTLQADVANARPALQAKISGPWTIRPVVENQYDSRGVRIGSIFWAYLTGANLDTTDTQWEYQVYMNTSESPGGAATGQLRVGGTTSASGTLSTNGNTNVYAFTQLIYNTAVGGAAKEYDLSWTCLAVYGNHGLTKRGTASLTAPQGFYADDIVRDAIGRAVGTSLSETDPVAIRIDDASSYLITQLEYRDGTNAHDVIDQMAKTVAYHWGVWEPIGLHSPNPGFYFMQRPTDATVFASRRQFDDFDPPKFALDNLYDYVGVSYTDQAGVRRRTTVNVPNAALTASGYSPRYTEVDLGIGTLASAQTFGLFVLNLIQASARGAGSGTLADDVLTTSGRKPSCLVKAGRDRIRVLDLPDPGPLHETDPRRFDTFRIRRVETTLERGGKPLTRIEFDGGADLIEVLTARLADAAGNSPADPSSSFGDGPTPRDPISTE